MFDWSLVVPLLINTIVVSVPEEAYFLVFTLIFMRRFEALEINKTNILKIIAVVVPMAFISNILRGFANFNMDYAIIVGFCGIFLFTVLIYKIRSKNGILKTLLAVTVSFIVAIVVQLLYFPFVFYGSSITIEELNKPGMLAIGLSMIDRILQIGIIVFLFLKKREFIKINLLKIITKNKKLACITGSVIFLNLIFLYIMCILVYVDKILLGLSSMTQVAVIAVVILIPLLNVSVMLGAVNYLFNKYLNIKIYMQEESKVLRVLVRLLLQQHNYDEVDRQIESFEKEIRKFK